MADLKKEYATLNADKKKMYSEINQLRADNKDLLIAIENVDLLLAKNSDGKIQDDAQRKIQKRRSKER